MQDHAVISENLSNGLTVLLKEMHSAPLISHWVWLKVGSRLEKSGQKGLAHWVEHMQFKGTQKYSSATMDRMIAREGGVWNAFTFLDWTAYFETLPAEKIGLAMDLEAERLCNSLFDAREVESERTVIISEMEGSENEPLYRLGKAVQEALFSRHPYRFETIGTKENLLSITRDELYGFYQDNYTPGNVILSIAGDFKTDEMLKKVEEKYGSIPAGKETASATIAEEPASTKEQIVDIEGPGETTFIDVAYHAPAATDPDFMIFSVLDSLLTGASSLNMFGGGGTSNKTSRLYKRLVEKSLAVGVGGGLVATIDPFIYDISITVHPRADRRAVMRVVDQEMERIREMQVDEAEVRRAVKQAKALFVYGSENITNQAFWLGYANMFADYDWFRNYIDRLEQVTPAEVQRIAQKYLLPENRVVGTYLPISHGVKK